jgi:hypothetical protein
MNAIEITNQINRSEALMEQYKNSELYTEADKQKRIAALKIEITRYKNRLREIESKTVNVCPNFKNIY